MTAPDTNAIDDKELVQFGYAPGAYMYRCNVCHCTGLMWGDKRNSSCRDCAVKAYEEAKVAHIGGGI